MQHGDADVPFKDEGANWLVEMNISLTSNVLPDECEWEDVKYWHLLCGWWRPFFHITAVVSLSDHIKSGYRGTYITTMNAMHVPEWNRYPYFSVFWDMATSQCHRNYADRVQCLTSCRHAELAYGTDQHDAKHELETFHERTRKFSDKSICTRCSMNLFVHLIWYTDSKACLVKFWISAYDWGVMTLHTLGKDQVAAHEPQNELYPRFGIPLAGPVASLGPQSVNMYRRTNIWFSVACKPCFALLRASRTSLFELQGSG